MNETKNYQIWNLQQPLRSGLERIFAFARARRREIMLLGQAHLQKNSVSSQSFNTLSEFNTALCANEIYKRWSVTIVMRGADEKLTEAPRVYLDADRIGFLVSYQSPDEDLLRGLICEVENAFGLFQLNEEVVRPFDPQATVCIGCHFDPEGRAHADRLRQFLRLLRFHRVEIADRFEGGEIPAKVKEVIDGNELYIGIVSGQRTHDWINGEAAYALGREKRVILVKQAQAVFSPTVLGMDREFIPFSSSIDEAFIPLLEGFRALRVIGI